MPHTLALAVEIVTTFMTVAGIGYFFTVIVAAQLFLRERRAKLPVFAPGVSILKSLKGLDPGMMDAFRSHCRQAYFGDYELLFGVASPDEPAISAVNQLRIEFPEHAIRLIECPARLGTNAKVSVLAQLVPHARYDYLIINDSDITVSARYLERVMAHFSPAAGARSIAEKPVGLVTALYRGRAHGTLASRLEALGISTEFQPGVLVSKMMEGGLRFGLGSTLAVSRAALTKIGGLEVLKDQLADDYELGVRVAAAGYRIALSGEAVETSVPAYRWRGFVDHQLRWLRTVRDARPMGYAGLVFTHGLAWALANVVTSGLSPVSLWLLGLVFFLRLAEAMTVGAAVLGDRRVLDGLWLLPLRDLIATGLWIAGFAGDTIVWRGERFVLKDGKLKKADENS
jgi:ceramide glucosyltransferase